MYLCADAAVVGQQIHTVARTSGERGEQQGRVQRGVETGYVTDTSRRGTARVQDDEDVTVPLGTPCAHRDGGLTCGGSPVDGAGVVAGHIRAQAVELRALATGEDTGAAVELAESGETGRQMLPAGEGRQDPYRPRDLVIPLPGGQAQRPERADGDALGPAVTAPCRPQEGSQPTAFACRDREGVPRRALLRAGGPAAGRPCVAKVCPQLATGRIGYGELHFGCFAKSNACFTGSSELKRSHWCSQGVVAENCQRERCVDCQHSGPTGSQDAYRE